MSGAHVTLVANARMYSVTPEAAQAWHALFRRIAALARLDLTIIDHAYPSPLNELWSRPDLACAFMCGWPYARQGRGLVPVAAPVPLAAGGPCYWTDLIVPAASPFQRMEDAFGARLAFTAPDSQSGFNAVRHFLRRFDPPAHFRALIGPLVTPRRALQAVIDGTADIAPLDSYAHALFRRHAPALASQVRVLARTEATPIPLLIASAATPPTVVAALRSAFLALTGDPALAPLQLEGFAEPPAPSAYAVLEAWARADGRQLALISS